MNPAKPATRGKLRIGDDWNAITIIALSQSNPLKSVAELVENSIDANARNILITRGKDKGQHYLRIRDDGDGVRRNADGEPDFQYVATHVCDSIKRRMLRGAPSHAEIALHLPAVRQGAGAEELRRRAAGAAPGAPARAHALHRGEFAVGAHPRSPERVECYDKAKSLTFNLLSVNIEFLGYYG